MRDFKQSSKTGRRVRVGKQWLPQIIADMDGVVIEEPGVSFSGDMKGIP
ncbi:MAG TPA: hypothetical protein VE975_05600 [Actinomycetota bacterium]|jgi:hypothetical protein|nr:hypothetical protein [Actinomycetota bacterium]